MRIAFRKIEDVPLGFWRWPHFTPKELADKVSGALVIETDFLDRLENLRRLYARPMILNSAYRTPEHNVEVSDTGQSGPHTTGRAVDVRVYGTYAFELVSLAFAVGFTGIGFAQKHDKHARYLHIDDLVSPAFPRPTIWTY